MPRFNKLRNVRINEGIKTYIFNAVDSRALIVRRNLTLDLYDWRLKLQIQSLTGGRTRRGIRFSSSARACRERGDNATRFNNSERFFPPFFSYFFARPSDA